MSTIELKKRIKGYIDQADDRMLHILNAIIQADMEEQYTLSEEQKDELDKRLQFHQENPGSGRSWAAVKADLEAKYDL